MNARSKDKSCYNPVAFHNECVGGGGGVRAHVPECDCWPKQEKSYWALLEENIAKFHEACGVVQLAYDTKVLSEKCF